MTFFLEGYFSSIVSIHSVDFGRGIQTKNRLFTFIFLFCCLFPSEFVCEAIADVAFIVDSSGSIGRRNWARMLQFLKDMVKAFNVGPDKTHIAVVAYSTGAVLEFRFNRLTGSAVTEEGYYGLIDRIRFQRGFTFIDKALLMADRDIFTTAAGMRQELPQVSIRNYVRPLSVLEQ